MAVTYQNTGAAFNAAAANIAATNPSGLAVGDLQVIVAVFKGGPVSQPTITDWTSLGGASHGSVAGADDVGSMRVFIWTRVATTGSIAAAPSAAWGTQPTAGNCRQFALRNATGSWGVALATGARTGTDTAWSVTYDSDPGIVVNDAVVSINAVPTDANTASSTGAFSATGATFNSLTALAHQVSTSGTDSAYWWDFALVTAGPATTPVTYTSTLTGGSPNLYGISALLRAREVTASDSVAGTIDVPVDLSGALRTRLNVAATADLSVELSATARQRLDVSASADLELGLSGSLTVASPDSVDGTVDVPVDLTGTLSLVVADSIDATAELDIDLTATLNYVPDAGSYLDLAGNADRTTDSNATLDVTITPTGTVDSLFTQVNVVMPLPDLDSNGMVDPDVFVPTSVTRTDWGRIQVVLGGRDVTELRGVPTEVVSYSNGEPFGDMTCVLRFPGITPFEGAGALSLTGLTMFAGNPDVTLRRIHPDGTVDPTEQALWQGLLASDDDTVDDGSFSGLTVQCMGALYQASLQVHQPAFELNARDIGTVIPQVLNSALGRRYATTANVATGIMTRKRGSWGPKLDFVQELLSDAVTEDGEQWTIRLLKGRKPVLVLKDMDTFHHTMTTGTQGLRINMQRDRTQATNVVYGEGVAQDQCRWRNTRYPANGRAFFEPLAELASTQPYLYDEDGNITGPNPIFDPKVIRVERWEQFGEGVQPGQGVTSAQGEIGRANTVDFSGTLTLAIDPEEGSRFAMRAGENLVLKQYRGANRVLHIAKVDVNVQSQTVTLAVDSQARDLATLAQVRLRNRDATDPARALVGRRTQSRTQQDQRAVWDCENGAGTIPSTALAVGWNVIPVPAGQAGSVVRTFMSTSPARRFSVAVFGRPVTPSLMNRLAPTPLTASSGGSIYDANAVVLDGAGLLIAFGGPDNACGYYPYTDPDSGAPGLHTLTGDLLDDGGWEYSSLYPPTIWVAVFVTATCTITGRLYQSVNGG